MKETATKSEVAMEKIQALFKKRGKKALEAAKKAVFEEKLESKEVQQALAYFMNEYWHDLARPSLMALTCEAVGGNPELTLPIAVPMSLISGAVDIHDDIIDQSISKDGYPTVYGKFGKEIALLVGDALLFKGLTLLNLDAAKNIPKRKMEQVVDVIKTMFFELGDAEALELRFRGSFDVSPEDYLEVVRKKAADVEAHTRISAILGDASPILVEALGQYGRLLGMLIILRDDWIDVFDVEEIRNRIKKESLPLAVLYGLRDPTTRNELETVLRKRTITREDAESISVIIEKSNVSKIYAKLMRKLVENASTKLRRHEIKGKKLLQLAQAAAS